MSPIFNVSIDQIKKITIHAFLVMALAGLAYVAGILPNIVSNPLVLAMLVALVGYIQEYLTDAEGRLGGIF